MDPGWGAVGDVVERCRRARPQAECGGGQGFPSYTYNRNNLIRKEKRFCQSTDGQSATSLVKNPKSSGIFGPRVVIKQMNNEINS